LKSAFRDADADDSVVVLVPDVSAERLRRIVDAVYCDDR
jgi:hypothetical protein